jgi:peptidoglycan/LPS O-acetylase OafA/YrhL
MAMRYRALDGWRGFAALAITFYHLPIDHAFRGLSNWKNMEIFVDLFFVLSGFVIAHAWRDRLGDFAAAKTFMFKRFWRVWPLHIFVLAIFFALEGVKLAAFLMGSGVLENRPFTGYTSVPSLISNIFLVQSLGLHGSSTWNAPAWSISVEFWVYVAFALVMLALSRHAMLGFIALAAMGALVLAQFSDLGLLATHDLGFFRGLFGFFLGVITQAIVAAQTGRRAHGDGAEIGIILLLIVFLMVSGRDSFSLLGPVIFAVLVYIFANGAGFLTRFFESEPMQRLGLWSYSIYMIHVLLFNLVRIGLIALEKVTGLPLTASGEGGNRLFSFGSGALDALAIGGLIGVSIALASLSYRSIEVPFMAKAR